MDNNTETRRAIKTCVSHLTDIEPDIYFHKGSSSITISWKDEIPDAVTTSTIEEALKQFGYPTPQHCRESKLVCFMIHR